MMILLESDFLFKRNNSRYFMGLRDLTKKRFITDQGELVPMCPPIFDVSCAFDGDTLEVEKSCEEILPQLSIPN